MALKGNLRDFSITQMLNLINLAQKSGTLAVHNQRGIAMVAFIKGKLAWAGLDRKDINLSQVLHHAKIISSAQFFTLKKRASEMSDKELGLLLINSGYVTQQQVLQSLQRHYSAILMRLFDWDEGEFYFDRAAIIPEDRIPVRVNLENIIIEGSRRAQELKSLMEELPNLDLALKFLERPGVDIKNIRLSEEEWRVVNLVNPKNTIQQIAKAAKLNDLQIRRIVFSLLNAGLVELVRHEDQLTLPTLDKAIPGNKEEQRNLVNRLIHRIRSL